MIYTRTIVNTCGWIPTTDGEPLRGSALVIHHDRNKAELVAGTETYTADELDGLIAAVREAQRIMREREEHTDE